MVFYLVSTSMIVLTNYTPEYEFCTSQLDISILCSLNMALCPQDTSFFFISVLKYLALYTACSTSSEFNMSRQQE